MRNLKDEISRDKLEALYSRYELSMDQIASRLGSNRESVRKLLHHYGIVVRSRAGGNASKRAGS